jgi:dihydrofolate synthase / folylpolyglutamate synthase
MNAPRATTYLDELGIDAMKSRRPSLHRMEAICAALDHPERTIPAIHVAGTNGKSSIARIASSVLDAAGLKVGTYTSPHLSTVRERLALAGEPLDDDTFQEVFEHLWPYLNRVEEQVGESLTYFEVVTAMYLLWAAEQPVDVSVVEVGLGGAWDATNVVNAPVGVLSNVALDHTELLGADRETIAREKAGIAKRGAVVVTAERTPSVLEVISEVVEHAGASLSVIDRDFEVLEDRPAVGGRYISVRTSGNEYRDVLLSLYGRHQALNAAVALEAVARFLPSKPLEQSIIEEALVSTRVPARLEVIQPRDGEAPAVVLDVAHNPDGASTLVKGLTDTLPFARVVFVLGAVEDKDYEAVIAELARVPSLLVLTQPRGRRALPVSRLQEAAKRLGLPHVSEPDLRKAVIAALTEAAPEDVVCITGSHYVVGEVRATLGEISGGRYAPAATERRAPVMEGQ